MDEMIDDDDNDIVVQCQPVTDFFLFVSGFCRVMRCSAAYAGMRCLFVRLLLSVCPCVCHVRELRRNE